MSFEPPKEADAMEAFLQVINEEPIERWPTVEERMEDLGVRFETLGPSTFFMYSWDHGYEKLTRSTDGSGSSEYRGSFHPVGGLCIGNPCDYCGAVTHD